MTSRFAYAITGVRSNLSTVGRKRIPTYESLVEGRERRSKRISVRNLGPLPVLRPTFRKLTFAEFRPLSYLALLFDMIMYFGLLPLRQHTDNFSGRCSATEFNIFGVCRSRHVVNHPMSVTRLSGSIVDAHSTVLPCFGTAPSIIPFIPTTDQTSQRPIKKLYSPDFEVFRRFFGNFLPRDALFQREMGSSGVDGALRVCDVRRTNRIATLSRVKTRTTGLHLIIQSA
jgi:hypothetical protein